MAIATLIAAGRLDDRLIDRAIAAVRDIGSSAAFLAWIDEGDAADLSVDGDLRTIREALETLDSVDVVVQPGSHRFKRLLVADMDSTMIGQECIDELADFAGLRDEVAQITEMAMQGMLDFEEALRRRVALLSGLEEQAIRQCLAERVIPNRGAATLVRTMRERGARTILVSGGFLSFAQPVAEWLGFDEVRANRLEIEASRLTGEVAYPVVDSTTKRDVLIAARERLHLQPGEVLAIGDGANDRPMVEEAGLGVAFRAKPALAKVADARLDYHGLDALLWVQGIPRRFWQQDGD